VVNLERYLNDIVKPTVADFEANPISTRHAFLACLVTCHAPDYSAHPEGATAKRQKFRLKSPDFKIADDVGHAFKHVVVGKRTSPRLRADQVIARPPAFWGHAVWNLSRWGDKVGGVTLDNDHTVDILEVLNRAVEFLRLQID
jgi:hypothetical protein